MTNVDSETLIPESDFFCAVEARESGEQIFGTAADSTTVWLILEYPYAWGAQALAESALPDAVKTRLAEWTQSIPGARIQLIKQDSVSGTTPSLVTHIPHRAITFFVAVTREAEQRVYRFALDSYADLLELDVPALAEHEPDARFAAHHHAEPVYLVCTNGRRDRCCAKWGLPFYQAMCEHVGDAVWQTTHTGGHRFAATMICFPQGVFYGWLTPEDAPTLVDAHARGDIFRLDRYRGRSCYPRAVQAADYYLRNHYAESGLDPWRLLGAESSGASEWIVTFRAADNGDAHQLRVSERPVDRPLPQSCGKAAKPASCYTLEALSQVKFKA